MLRAKKSSGITIATVLISFVLYTYICQIGTKEAALKCNPEKYFIKFDKIDGNSSYNSVEQYLVVYTYSAALKQCTPIQDV